jgi:hypothetical protein
MIYKINKQLILEETSINRRFEKALTKAVVISKVRDNPNNLKKLMKNLATSNNIGTPKENKTIKIDKQTSSNISNSAKKIIKEKSKKESKEPKEPKEPNKMYSKGNLLNLEA